MYPVRKLSELDPSRRLRKALLALGAAKRVLALSGSKDSEALAYIRDLLGFLSKDESIPSDARTSIHEALGHFDTFPVDSSNRAELVLESLAGKTRADWDLVDPGTLSLDASVRESFPGMQLYLEDIRSPYNVGSIFRTSESFGVGSIILSRWCADPEHPRSLKVSKGTTLSIPWSRGSLDSLEAPLFALETGGTDISSFDFPASGTMIVGSEELGISPLARERVGGRIVTIPTNGAKGSLNVAVSFGIVVREWFGTLRKRSPSPIV